MSIEIDHLGIAVRSLREGRAFYEELLGMAVVQEEKIEAEQVVMAMLPTADGGGPRIELLEATDGNSTVAKFIEKRGPGLHHIALRVDDLASVIANLKASGARLMSEPRVGAGGHTYVFIHPASAGGVLVELVQK